MTKTGKGVNSVEVLDNGAYKLRIQNDEWNTVDCKIEVIVGSDGKITFTGGNKYILDAGFNNTLWQGNEFELTSSQREFLKTEYGLEFIT